MLSILSLNEDDQHATRAENLAAKIHAVAFLVSCKRNVNAIVARQSENFSESLMHADDHIAMATHPNVLADRSIDRIVRKKIRHDVRTNDTNISARRAFALGPKATDVDRNAVNLKHRDRINPPHRDSVDFLIAALRRLN